MPELTAEEYRAFRQLLDKDAIRDVLTRVSRGVDRLDPETLRGAYWPDAQVYSCFFDGPIEAFIGWLQSAFPLREIGASHNICNVKIDVDGDTAWGETYFLGSSENRPEGGEPFNNISSGRYLDRFEKRGDEWRIRQRTFVYEWTARLPHHTGWTQPPLAGLIRRGRRDRGDPVFGMREPGFPG
jgi:hypothetical protein